MYSLNSIHSGAHFTILLVKGDGTTKKKDFLKEMNGVGTSLDSFNKYSHYMHVIYLKL